MHTHQTQYASLPMFPLLRQPLMDVETTTTGGTPPAPPVTPPAGTPDRALVDKLTGVKDITDLDAPVRIGGKLLTAGDIIKMQDTLANLTNTLTEHQKLSGAMAVLFSKEQAPREKSEPALRQVLTARGFTPEEIEAQVKLTYEDDDPATPPPVAPKEDPRTRRHEKVTTSLVNRTIRDGVLSQFNDPKNPLSTLIEGIRRRDGDAAATALREDLAKDLVESVRGKIARKQAEGSDFDVDWIDEITPLEAKAIAARITKWTGDPRTLGAAPDAAGTTAALEEIASKKLPDPPRFQHGMSPADVDKLLSDDIAARFLRQDAMRELGRV